MEKGNKELLEMMSLTEEINSISYDISNATSTLKPIFNHDLANNNGDNYGDE